MLQEDIGFYHPKKGLTQMGRKSRGTISALVGLLLILAACSDDDSGATTTSSESSAEPAEARLVSSDRGTLGFIDFSTTDRKSFGLFVCTEGGDIVVESVEAMASTGSIEVIGGYFYAEPEDFVGAVNGFPPVGVDEANLINVEGARVQNRCSSAEDGRSQVLVGARRIDGAGGRIEGIRIIHSSGILELPDYDIILCGDAMEFCGDLEGGNA